MGTPSEYILALYTLDTVPNIEWPFLTWANQEEKSPFGPSEITAKATRKSEDLTAIYEERWKW